MDVPDERNTEPERAADEPVACVFVVLMSPRVKAPRVAIPTEPPMPVGEVACDVRSPVVTGLNARSREITWIEPAEEKPEDVTLSRSIEMVPLLPADNTLILPPRPEEEEASILNKDTGLVRIALAE